MINNLFGIITDPTIYVPINNLAVNQIRNNIENIHKIVMNVLINVKMDNFNIMIMTISVQMKNLVRMAK